MEWQKKLSVVLVWSGFIHFSQYVPMQKETNWKQCKQTKHNFQSATEYLRLVIRTSHWTPILNFVSIIIIILSNRRVWCKDLNVRTFIWSRKQHNLLCTNLISWFFLLCDKWQLWILYCRPSKHTCTGIFAIATEYDAFNVYIYVCVSTFLWMKRFVFFCLHFIGVVVVVVHPYRFICCEIFSFFFFSNAIKQNARNVRNWKE